MKKQVFISIFMLVAAVSYGQLTEIYSSPQVAYDAAITLYEQGHYEASMRAFGAYRGVLNADEAGFYELANSFELRNKNMLPDLKAYMKLHPYSCYIDELHFMTGVLQVEKTRYKQALKELDKVDQTQLFRPHQADYLFYKGYAYLQQKELAKASQQFQKLRKLDSKYTLQARYYYAYCQYSQENYSKALPEFLAIEHTAQFKRIVPYYIIQIYYQQGQYDEVYERAEYMLSNDAQNEHNGELHRMLGEIYYRERRYDKAVEHLSEYQKLYSSQKKELQREDIYLLGMSYYEQKDYKNAATYLSKMKKENDLISENACYHLGNAYVQLKQTDKAKLAYSAAMRYKLNEQVREEAMYNYALCTYQSSSALGESVTAFTDFLEQYPQSKYREQVIELLSDVFLSSKNYVAALQALDNIEKPDAKLLETKQFLRYQIGADGFIQNDMEVAIDYFTAVIDNSKKSSEYKTESYFMRSESHYRKGDYASATADMKSFLQQPNVKNSKNYKLANYSLGYTLFSQKNYKESLQYFLSYINIADRQSPTYPDALNRIGDCYFNARDFVNAENYYAKVIAVGQNGVDYATFQRGYALGLLKRHDDKINLLEKLVKQYPKSDYADDALYEISRAHLQREQNEAAIEAYNRLLVSYPNSKLARKAALEKGMIYYNLQQYEPAIESYKGVIKNYPGSNEAYAALDGLESIYIETNNIAEYLAYTKQLGRINMKTDSREDSLMYVAAERQYMLGNYSQATAGFSKYVSQFCSGGRYCTMAQYYLADSYYKLNDKDNALQEYQKLTEINGNPYIEEALTRAAEITYDKENYKEALQYFSRLQAVASSMEKMNVARLGILRCSYLLKDNEQTIDVASKIIDDASSPDNVVAEARYNRAKANYNLTHYAEALPDLLVISKEVRTAQGAEAKYLLADVYFKQNDLDKSEEEIMSFASMNTAHQYWLARSFILLADIYDAKGDEFQARQYLLSLQANYKVKDDIAQIVEERLKQLDSKPQIEPQPEINDTDDDTEK